MRAMILTTIDGYERRMNPMVMGSWFPEDEKGPATAICVAGESDVFIVLESVDEIDMMFAMATKRVKNRHFNARPVRHEDCPA